MHTTVAIRSETLKELSKMKKPGMSHSYLIGMLVVAAKKNKWKV